MDRGRTNKLAYVGGGQEIEAVEHAIAATNHGCGGGKHTRRANEEQSF